MLNKILVMVSLAIMPCIMHAQAAPTEKKLGDLQIGAGLDILHPDFSTATIKGYTFYGDFDFLRHFGVEGEFRQSSIGGPASIYERNYLIGPRYVLHYKRLDPYAKFLIGRGVFNYPQNTANLAYNMLSMGGGVDLRVLSHLNVRLVDFEYQRWLGFQNDTLTPTVITFGAAYHF